MKKDMVKSKGFSLDGDRDVRLWRAPDGTLQIKLSKSGISAKRCVTEYTPCKCGKGRTTVQLGISDEAIQSLFVLYQDLLNEEICS